MALSIRNPKAEQLARQVAALSGENVTQAIIQALEKRLQDLKAQPSTEATVQEIMCISRRCSALPDRDCRSAEAILGYDEIHGAPQK